MSRMSFAVVVAALALSGEARPVYSQFFMDQGASSSPTNIEGFTVAGKGFASAKPNRLEIDLEISAASELTADAIVKYRDAKKRLQEAFAALKLENVTVEERGLNVDQKGSDFNPYFFDYQPNRKAKVEVQLSRKLVVKCGNIRKLDEEALLQLVAKLLDVAQDAGGKVGGSGNEFNPYMYNRFNRGSTGGLVRFILDDFDKLEEEAYGKAITDAATRAKRLAKLSDVKLKSVSAVREIVSPGQHASGDDDEPKKRLESSRFQEIPVRVELMVRYDVAPLPEANGRLGEK